MPLELVGGSDDDLPALGSDRHHEARLPGTARQPPPGLDLAAYRVIHEALTNVLKHAPGARATVAIRYRPGGIDVEVLSAARRPATGELTRGQGLHGMAERVALYDGRFEAGWVDDAFRVSARFPVDEPRADA